jgi:hypothetical protein
MPAKLRGKFEYRNPKQARMPDDPNPKLRAPDVEVLGIRILAFVPSFAFSQMRLLDRYIIRNFLQPYFYCILGFLSIWLIFDISDNSSIIFDERAPFLLVLKFYWSQVPQVLVVLLPVSLLLALLFCLGRMSRSNEIVSMLTAGVSVPRVVLPLLVIGLLTTGACLCLELSHSRLKPSWPGNCSSSRS